MNLLEHFIKEIHSEEKIDTPSEPYSTWIRADITINCYGTVKRIKRVFSEEAWLRAKELGYYLS